MSSRQLHPIASETTPPLLLDKNTKTRLTEPRLQKFKVADRAVIAFQNRVIMRQGRDPRSGGRRDVEAVTVAEFAERYGRDQGGTVRVTILDFPSTLQDTTST